MKDNLNIEKLFQDKFENFEADVNPNLWNNIAQGISTNAAVTTTGLSVAVKSLIIGASAIAVGTAAYIVNDLYSAKNQKLVAEQTKTPENRTVVPTTENNETINFVDTTEEVENNKIELVEESILEEKEVLDKSTNQKNDIAPHTIPMIEIDLVDKPISITSITIDDKQTDLIVKEDTKPEDSKVVTTTDKDDSVHNNEEDVDKPDVVIEEKTNQVKIGEVPNVFTPDNDGVNDYFMFETENVDAFTVIITNQFDQTVFESNNPKFEWDGRDLGGNLVPNAVYNYFVIAIGADKIMVKTAGQVYVR